MYHETCQLDFSVDFALRKKHIPNNYFVTEKYVYINYALGFITTFSSLVSMHLLLQINVILHNRLIKELFNGDRKKER